MRIGGLLNFLRRDIDWASRQVASVRHPATASSRDEDVRRLQRERRIALVRRRGALSSAFAGDENFDIGELPPCGALGIAFSGGGERSACISLGIAQGFSSFNRLHDFDYMSTVSGGGYFGSFLGGLFMPPKTRGLDLSQPVLLKASELASRRQFVDRVLNDNARQTLIDPPEDEAGEGQSQKIRNPIWWLREHSRYLAPNGPTDYAKVLTVVVRNWLAMIYVFSLPVFMTYLGMAAIEDAIDNGKQGAIGKVATWSYTQLPNLLRRSVDSIETCFVAISNFIAPGITGAAGAVGMRQSAFAGQLKNGNSLWSNMTECCGLQFSGENFSRLSPLLFLALASVLFALASGSAYWLTKWARTPKRLIAPRKCDRPSLRYFGLILAGASFFVMLHYLIDYAAAGLPVIARCTLWLVDGFGFALLGMSVLFAFWVFLNIFTLRNEVAKKNPVDELRHVATSCGAIFNQLAFIFLAAGLVDCAARWVVLNALEGSGSSFSATYLAIIAPILPVATWLIGKLPNLAGKGSGWLQAFLTRYVWTAALVIGVVMYALLAVSIDVAVRLLLVPQALWDQKHPLAIRADGMVDPHAWDLFFFVGFVALTATGLATGFINLSSLHNFYKARLTRAYLGGSNTQRLLEVAGALSGSPISENHPTDDVEISVYQRTVTAAPLHIINVTLNETRNREGSQMIERDRKGVPLVFAPEGLLLDAGRDQGENQRSFFTWAELGQVESLTLGQLCAISGAAASSGMGSNTTLGGALALTFANIRLGYWWHVGKMVRQATGASRSWPRAAYINLTGWLRTYFYLFNEMTGRYSRDYKRLYLSDGGHFENSGVYELLRRETKVIVACDNGADPNLAFDDLENLVRKARMDLGMAITVAEPDKVTRLFGKAGESIFFNCKDGDWRKLACDRNAPHYALLLEVYKRPKGKGSETKADFIGQIIWLKPKVFPDVPADVTGYALNHPTFPQETTADQFFDEEQWESYRALGYCMVRKLVESARPGENFLRKMAERTK